MVSEFHVGELVFYKCFTAMPFSSACLRTAQILDYALGVYAIETAILEDLPRNKLVNIPGSGLDKFRHHVGHLQFQQGETVTWLECGKQKRGYINSLLGYTFDKVPYYKVYVCGSDFLQYVGVRQDYLEHTKDWCLDYATDAMKKLHRLAWLGVEQKRLSRVLVKERLLQELLNICIANSANSANSADKRMLQYFNDKTPLKNDDNLLIPYLLGLTDKWDITKIANLCTNWILHV